MNTEGLRQLGWCETCGDAAYSSRWDEQLIFDMVNGELVYKRTEPIEHYMCARHKTFYFKHMERRRKALEAKTKQTQKGCR